MKTKFVLLSSILAPALCLSAAAQGTAFTYQGLLEFGGGPANGSYDLTFSLWDGPAGPTQVGSTLTNQNVTLSKGVVTVKLDFGAGIFTGADRWLEIGIRTNGGNAFTLLSPRQPITPAPYAMFAANAGGGGGSIWSLSGANAYYNGGNVGIGSSTPNHRLRLSGGPSWTTAFWSGALELDNAAAIGWRANASGNRFGIGQSSGGLYFFATGSDPGNTANPPNYLMTFDDFGKVGIGTSTPANRLTVANPGYGIEHTDGTIRVGTYAGLGAGWFGTINNYPLSFYVNGGGASMTIDTAGNVGIGAASSGSKLHVIGNQRVEGRLSVNTPPDATLTIRTENAPGIPLIVYNFNGAEIFRFAGQSSGSYMLMSGNAYKTSGGTTWSIPSDRRVKKDIRDYEHGLDEILQLRPVRFHYRDDASRGLSSANEEVGVIAQEVREVIPDAVTEGKDGYLSLKADPIHWATIRAIQELNAKVETRREHPDARIEKLETENTALKARLTHLENLITQLSAKRN